MLPPPLHHCQMSLLNESEKLKAKVYLIYPSTLPTSVSWHYCLPLCVPPFLSLLSTCVCPVCVSFKLHPGKYSFLCQSVGINVMRIKAKKNCEKSTRVSVPLVWHVTLNIFLIKCQNNVKKNKHTFRIVTQTMNVHRVFCRWNMKYSCILN